MPDLGQYAFEILAAWGVSLALLGAVIAASMIRARRVRLELERIEGGGDGD